MIDCGCGRCIPCEKKDRWHPFLTWQQGQGKCSLRPLVRICWRPASLHWIGNRESCDLHDSGAWLIFKSRAWALNLGTQSQAPQRVLHDGLNATSWPSFWWTLAKSIVLRRFWQSDICSGQQASEHCQMPHICLIQLQPVPTEWRRLMWLTWFADGIDVAFASAHIVDAMLMSNVDGIHIAV